MELCKKCKSKHDLKKGCPEKKSLKKFRDAPPAPPLAPTLGGSIAAGLGGGIKKSAQDEHDPKKQMPAPKIKYNPSHPNHSEFDSKKAPKADHANAAKKPVMKPIMKKPSGGQSGAPAQLSMSEKNGLEKAKVDEGKSIDEKAVARTTRNARVKDYSKAFNSVKDMVDAVIMPTELSRNKIGVPREDIKSDKDKMKASKDINPDLPKSERMIKTGESFNDLKKAEEMEKGRVFDMKSKEAIADFPTDKLTPKKGKLSLVEQRKVSEAPAASAPAGSSPAPKSPKLDPKKIAAAEHSHKEGKALIDGIKKNAFEAGMSFADLKKREDEMMKLEDDIGSLASHIKDVLKNIK